MQKCKSTKQVSASSSRQKLRKKGSFIDSQKQAQSMWSAMQVLMLVMNSVLNLKWSVVNM